MKNFEQHIEEYLLEESKKDSTFCDAFNGEKTIKGACSYIYDKVTKMNKDKARCLAIKKEDVFSMAKDYFLNNDVNFENKPIPENVVQAVASNPPVRETKVAEPKKPARKDAEQDVDIFASFFNGTEEKNEEPSNPFEMAAMLDDNEEDEEE